MLIAFVMNFLIKPIELMLGFFIVDHHILVPLPDGSTFFATPQNPPMPLLDFGFNVNFLINILGNV